MESATLYLLENSNPTEPDPYSYWYKPTFSKTEPTNTVVLPEGVVADEWVITYNNNMDVASSGALKIGFDGNDVYLQGLNSFLTEAWIKGTLEGTTITFPGRQYFGFYQDSPYSGYDMYLQDEDVLFTYDADANKMTAITEEITIYTSTLLKGDIYKNAVITKVIEKAAIPATPNISQIYDSSTGPVVMYTVPTLDVDGNAIASSKLTFQFLSDIEQEITPVTFDPADYSSLSEAMTIFPYGFKDNTELFPTYMYLKQADYSQWNKIGIQSIYKGNGETLNPQKLFYTVWVEQDGQQMPYIFKSEMYYGIEEDATEVPYSFNYSSWDGSHNIYFQDGVEECGKWTKVGIQSIYYGGDECNKTDVVWIDNPNASGISDIAADIEAGKAVIYNIAGQRYSIPQKGLNIINGRKVVIK
jgi:hypothetical protein